MTLTPMRSRESARKNFSWTRRTSCLESGIRTFLGSGGRNDSNTHHFARIGEKKIFMNSTYIMSKKMESKVFGFRRAKWLQHPSVRTDRRENKFSWTLRTSCLESSSRLFSGSGGRNDSNTHSFARISEIKFFSWTRRTSCLESGNHTFLRSGGRNDSNTHQFAEIGEKKIFYERDVHHV